MENLKTEALEIMKKICETDEVCDDLDLDLFEAGLIDSFGAIEILLEIEERFHIRLQPADIKKENIETVNSFVRFLEKVVE